jgi:hypothetical protein
MQAVIIMSVLQINASSFEYFSAAHQCKQELWQCSTSMQAVIIMQVLHSNASCYNYVSAANQCKQF